MTDRDSVLVTAYSLFAGAVLGFTIAQIAKVPTLCSADNLNCIRDWLAATSGWAAVIAAAITALIINQQIRRSSEQHLEQMKFQAFEKLTTIQQVSQAASSAYGTVTQVFHEFDVEKTARSKERMRREVNAAKFALDVLLSSQMPEKRMLVQGNIPPKIARADVALARFVEIGTIALDLSQEQFDGELGKGLVRASSGELVLAHMDLENLTEQMREIEKRWRHLLV